MSMPPPGPPTAAVPFTHGNAAERVNGPVGEGAVAWPMPYVPCQEPPEYRR